jgi:hypothetical protein
MRQKRNIDKILENKMLINIARFEVLTAVIMKSSVRWKSTDVSEEYVTYIFMVKE